MATKKAPIVKDAQFSRIFNDIYKTLNELSSSSENGAGKMATTKTGIRVNNAKFKLTKYDTLTYNNTVLSVLNERAGETSTIKLGSLAKFTSFQVAKTGNLTIDSPGDIEFNADGGDFAFKDDSADLASLSSSGLTINNISAIGSDTDKFLMSDSGVIKYVTGANLRSYIGAGTSTVANLNDLGDVTYSSGDLTITSLDTIISGDLAIDSSGDITLDADGGEIYFKDDGTTFGNVSTNGAYSSLTLYEDGGASSDDFFQIYTAANGATTIRTADAGGTAAHLTIDPDGDLLITGADVKIDATKKLYLDGGGDTYIYENSADSLKLFVGGDEIFRVLEQGTDGNQLYFYGASVGFNQLEPTYDATNTEVDFRLGNKQNLTFVGGSITNVKLTFPNMSGNFVLLLKQNGSGSNTVTNWKVFESDESSADGAVGVKWAGGSAPTLTTDANHVDIISFYWDADNEIAYGVATLDFQF
tara:strand:- start:306 stop:1724 length:1419 start_codon:yes stop_codon:yes gene_type:complete